MAALSGGLLVWQTIQGGGGRGIAPAEAVRLVNREKGVLVDVCEPAEYQKGHAVGARNIPLATLADAKGLPGNKTLPVVVLCASGARAGRAAAQLRKAGYEKAVAVAGGNAAWREANLPMESGLPGEKAERPEKGDKPRKSGKGGRNGKDAVKDADKAVVKTADEAADAPRLEAPVAPVAPVEVRPAANDGSADKA